MSLDRNRKSKLRKAQHLFAQVRQRVLQNSSPTHLYIIRHAQTQEKNDEMTWNGTQKGWVIRWGEVVHMHECRCWRKVKNNVLPYVKSGDKKPPFVTNSSDILAQFYSDVKQTNGTHLMSIISGFQLDFVIVRLFDHAIYSSANSHWQCRSA